MEGVPAYRVFDDKTLVAIVRARPRTAADMRNVTGVGEMKLQAYGGKFLTAIREFIDANPPPMSDRKSAAFEFFRNRASVTNVMERLKVARSTATEYLAQFIEAERPKDVAVWVSDELYQEVCAAIQEVGADRLKPIFEMLNEQVSYDDIRIVVAHYRARRG
jgi:ATP-dependent DNA helicase RecQ